MKVVKFETELLDNTINIPEDFRSALSLAKDKHVRVILLIDDMEKDEETVFKNITGSQFLKGYEEADSIYDYL